MDVRGSIGPAELALVMVTYRDALRSHQEAINRLNVYPVPDGDTGTNMALTLEAVVGQLAQVADPKPMAPTCEAIAHGSLMGARGNSGVILSQILRGMADALTPLSSVSAVEVARALSGAADAARRAVMRPVEGTILTVASRAGLAADRSGAEACSALVDVLESARAAGAEALAETPELLPVLAEAGVVDAGGAGFLLLLDSLLAVVAGRPVPEPPKSWGEVSAVESEQRRGAASGPRYEVMYLLEAPDPAVTAFKEVWAGIGDSIVVVGGDGVWNCHIHTDDVGAAVEAALDAGRPREIRVTDLLEQVEEERWVREAADHSPAETDTRRATTGVVAVATGEGVRRIFRSLGVHEIVAGGQSMNPSTAQILEAVEAVPADQVVVLPNNDNIVAVARQVDALSAKSVSVVATGGIAEGFAALLAYDPETGLGENVEAMTGAAERVVAAEVTRAVRASSCPAGAISEGDWIGLSSAGVEVVGEDLGTTVCALLEKLLRAEHEIVTLIEGQGASAAETRRVREWLSEAFCELSVEVHHGGQPIYPYLLSIE
jgi:fatty acid kinase